MGVYSCEIIERKVKNNFLYFQKVLFEKWCLRIAPLNSFSMLFSPVVI